MTICVFGAASSEVDKSYIDTMEKFGELMAQRGHELVFGAGGKGLMGATARGVKKGGGRICGVIPEFFKDERLAHIFEDCTELIFTKNMAERKATMEDRADAFIVVPGGVGTFEELFQVVTLKQLGRHTKPIALYDINGYYSKLAEFLEIAYGEKFVRQSCKELYAILDDAEEVLNYVENDKRIKRNVHDLKKS